MIIIAIYAILFCSLWVMVFLLFAWTIEKLPKFRNETKNLKNAMENWPRLSIIVPACNEAEHIQEAIQSLLDQDYPDLEIIAINDRSIDDTGQILNRLAETDPRLLVLHLDKLPHGWLGKVNALRVGAGRASGDWLLFTDADINYSPGLLKRAINFVCARNIDHLALLPEVKVRKFWLKVCINTFGIFFLLSSRAAQVNREKNGAPIGIGAFNLVQRKVFNRTPGFEPLKLEPADDYGLGLVIQKAGGRTHFALADEDLSVPWYGSVTAMFRGLEKNLFGPGAHYSLTRLVVLVSGLWLLAAAPAVSLLAGYLTGSGILLVAGGSAVFVHIAVAYLSYRKRPSDFLQMLFFPVGLLMIGLMFIWSGYCCIKNGGIDWRGTHYSLAALRKGQLVKF